MRRGADDRRLTQTSDTRFEVEEPARLGEARPAPAAPFAGVRSRASLDYAMPTVLQTQTQPSAMADHKASIMITVCSIVLTVGITRFESPILR